MICKCGCGEETKIYRGKHNQYMRGHNNIKKGSDHYNWKGGVRYTGDGYRQRWNPNHPFADSNGYVREHRLIWEQYNNCILLPWADVHHINGDILDNNIENLQIMDHKTHGKYHRLLQLEVFQR